MIDDEILHHYVSIMEQRHTVLATHLREIANNASYQKHKGIIKARRREIEAMHSLLNEIDDMLLEAIGEKNATEL